MSVVSVEARSFILALFIRDDGERFLLGDNGYDFIDSQLHFVANTIENDEVEKQGADGVMLAGQVRRASVQTFDGYVGDATTPKDKVEEMRREFIAFFAKGHHFRVIYVDCNRNAWQRKGGYLVDAPEVKELWQIHPEYHVGLNFEDVNYYEYDENAEGQEILANIMKVPISSDVEGGLVWDEDGAVSEDATVVYDGDTASASGTSITVSDAVEAPLSDFKLKGETSQNGTPTPSAPVPVQTVTGENVVKISDGQGNEQSYTIDLGSIELCKIGDYQDYIYKSGGKWYVHKAVGKIIQDGSVQVNYYDAPSVAIANDSLTAYFSVYGYGNYVNGIDYKSNMFGTPYERASAIWGNSSQPASAYQYEGMVKDGSALRVRIMKSRLTGWSDSLSAADKVNLMKAWLNNNNPVVYGALATATDTEITNEALISQLEAVLSQGKTYAGTNNITTVISAGNEQGELEVGYYTRYEFEITAGGYVWEQGGSGGPTIVTNESISAVSPVWTVYGPALNPQLENATNGDAIEYVGMVSDGQTLVIDMGEQTAKLDGLNVISNVTGDFISLESGANTLLYSAGNDAPESEIGWSEIVG